MQPPPGTPTRPYSWRGLMPVVFVAAKGSGVSRCSCRRGRRRRRGRRGSRGWPWPRRSAWWCVGRGGAWRTACRGAMTATRRVVQRHRLPGQHPHHHRRPTDLDCPQPFTFRPSKVTRIQASPTSGRPTLAMYGCTALTPGGFHTWVGVFRRPPARYGPLRPAAEPHVPRHQQVERSLIGTGSRVFSDGFDRFEGAFPPPRFDGQESWRGKRKAQSWPTSGLATLLPSSRKGRGGGVDVDTGHCAFPSMASGRGGSSVGAQMDPLRPVRARTSCTTSHERKVYLHQPHQGPRMPLTSLKSW